MEGIKNIESFFRWHPKCSKKEISKSKKLTIEDVKELAVKRAGELHRITSKAVHGVQNVAGLRKTR